MSLCDASSKKIQDTKTLRFSNKIPLKSIKMRPSYYPGKGLIGESKTFNFKPRDRTKQTTQLWQLNGRCPKGTIPIRRNQNRSNVKRYAKKKHESFLQLSSVDSKLDVRTGHEHVVAIVQGNKYFGAKATISPWQPQVQNPYEFCLSQIWIVGGPDSVVNTIEAGWMVSPYIFGDNRTKFFTFWTSDGYQSTGCYNLNCSGFIQTARGMVLGAAVYPLSTYHGAQFEITILIWKDIKNNVWWLSYQDEILVYWPASLLSYLADSASVIECGGEVNKFCSRWTTHYNSNG